MCICNVYEWSKQFCVGSLEHSNKIASFCYRLLLFIGIRVPQGTAHRMKSHLHAQCQAVKSATKMWMALSIIPRMVIKRKESKYGIEVSSKKKNMIARQLKLTRHMHSTKFAFSFSLFLPPPSRFSFFHSLCAIFFWVCVRLIDFIAIFFVFATPTNRPKNCARAIQAGSAKDSNAFVVKAIKHHMDSKIIQW